MKRDASPTRTAAQLRAIGGGQRAVVVLAGAQTALLACALLAAAGVVRDPHGDGRLTLALAGALIGLAGGVAVGGLAAALRGRAAGVVVGLLAAVPCLGLVVIGAVHFGASAALRRHGVRVGPFGASAADLAGLDDPAADADEPDDGW